jgi:hypothetical protein
VPSTTSIDAGALVHDVGDRVGGHALAERAVALPTTYTTRWPLSVPRCAISVPVASSTRNAVVASNRITADARRSSPS